MRTMIALAAAIALTAGCANQNLFGNPLGRQQDLGTAEAPAREPALEGTLKRAASGVGGGVLTVESSAGATAEVKLDSKTVMMRENGRRVSFSTFQAGQRLKVWFVDPQAGGTAETVMILE